MRTDDVRRVVHRVRSLKDVNETELGDEFFPAHLSVALIDAIHGHVRSATIRES